MNRAIGVMAKLRPRKRVFRGVIGKGEAHMLSARQQLRSFRLETGRSAKSKTASLQDARLRRCGRLQKGHLSNAKTQTG